MMLCSIDPPPKTVLSEWPRVFKQIAHRGAVYACLGYALDDLLYQPVQALHGQVKPLV